MIGDLYKHNKTGNYVTVEQVTQELLVKYRSPKGKYFESSIDKFFRLYSKASKNNPKECRHRWSEITLLTTTVKYCVLCDERKD